MSKPEIIAGPPRVEDKSVSSVTAPTATAAATSAWTCDAWRDALEVAVRERLSQPAPPAPRGGAVLHPATTVIACDLADFGAAEQADAAEPVIDWFSRDAGELRRQRACRMAFAALELQAYLRRITGDADGFVIHADASAEVDRARYAIRLETDCRPSDTDGRFEIVTESGGTIFRGLSIQGCLYAVYEYLEQLGCVFLEPGGASDVTPTGPVRAPQATRQTPDFYWRRLHGWRKNRATPDLIDWMGKARINTWGADNLVPGMRKRGILLASGMHDILPVLGLSEDFNVLNTADRRKLREGIVRVFADGPYTDADICEYIGADWGPRPKVGFEGNTTDLELLAIHEVRDALRSAYQSGRINRDVFVSGYAYFDCEDPPTMPMPEGFDSPNIAVEYWSMRCWEHLLDEQACSQDHPTTATMRHYAGQVVHHPSNRRIYDRLKAWAEDTRFTGRLGMGHYLSNAGNFYIPLVLSAALSYEVPQAHRLGVRQINFMHVSVSDWGPMMLTNYLYRKLGWSAGADAATLITEYFRARFADAAGAMAEAYSALERATAPLPMLKRIVVNWLNTHGSLAPVADLSHARRWTDPQRGVAASCRIIERVEERVGQVNHPAAAQDLRWVRYASLTLRLYRVVINAATRPDRGAADACELDEAIRLIEALRRIDLRLHLPEKIEADAAEASGLLPALHKMLKDAGRTVGNDGPRVQTDIMPVASYANDKNEKNRPLRYPDPSWPKPAPRNDLGLKIERLWRTGVKHAGCVSQWIDDRVLVAMVGGDAKADTDEYGAPHNSRLVCASIEGGIQWRRDFACHGCKAHIGPWPAFVDLTGRGDWAVSVHVMFDGGRGRRRGYIHLYDARTGALRWRHQTQAGYDYPGGNGACVATDIDGDGKIELVYGLCNQVLCLHAADGRRKWSYDDRIRICHGRFALADVNDDGRPEIVVATEYADQPDNPACDRSSILSLDGHGRLLRRLGNIQGDLGSTQVVAVDVDGDGKPEIIHGSENLVYHEPRHMGELFVLERWLTPKLDPVPTGGARFAVGDIDNDGASEAVGITSYRDGGPNVKPEIFCVRVRDGRVRWRTPIARTWLDGDAILVDVDGDGRLEAVVTANYPSGYMHQQGADPWSDLYIANADGRIVYQHTLPDAAITPIATTLDQSGAVHLLIPCYDGCVYRVQTRCPAQGGAWPLACRDAQRTGCYRSCTPANDPRGDDVSSW